MPDMSKGPLVMAYTAGLLDGEGHYGISKSPRPTGFIFRPVVTVGITHKPTVIWLQAQFGGSISCKPPTEKNAAQWAWSIRSRVQLLAFLPEVAKFAKLKRVHALFLHDFIQLFPRCTSAVLASTVEFQEMTKHYEILKALNARGPKSGDIKEEISRILIAVDKDA